MPKIKLLKIYDNYDYQVADQIKSYPYADWEEVSDEDLKFLKSPKGQQLLYKKCTSNENILLIEELKQKEVKEILSSIKDFIKEEKAKEEEAKFNREQKRAAALKKQEEKEIERAKKLLIEKGLL